MSEQVQLPPGTFIEWGGQFENLQAASRRLTIVIPVVFAAIFGILFLALKGARPAIAVYSAIPLGLAGGLFGLLLAGLPFSVSAAVGFIVLAGVGVLNGLVVMSAVNQRIEAGLPVDRAVTEGALVAAAEPETAPAREVEELPSEARAQERAMPEAEHEHAHEGPLGANSELLFVLVCGALLGAGFAIDKLWQAAPAWLSLGCYVGAYGFGGFFTLREAIDNLRLKRFEIDTLMLVAAVGAAALGAWAEGALLLFLFSLGHALEHYAMGRAKRAIEALADLAPRTALVRRPDGSTAEVGVEELAVGDVVIVKPDERIAADGFVIKGASAINQAPVTGESIPVDKRAVADPAQARANPDRLDAASRVFAGTINGSGAIEIEVTRLASETTLAKVVRMVNEAETQKSPTQRFTDRFERVFVPAVLGLATLLLFAWVVVDEPSRIPGMSDSPCI